MSRHASAPLTKITMNIYKADYEYLSTVYGQGWSEIVREWIKTRLDKERKPNADVG